MAKEMRPPNAAATVHVRDEAVDKFEALGWTEVKAKRTAKILPAPPPDDTK